MNPFITPLASGDFEWLEAQCKYNFNFYKKLYEKFTPSLIHRPFIPDFSDIDDIKSDLFKPSLERFKKIVIEFYEYEEHRRLPIPDSRMHSFLLLGKGTFKLDEVDGKTIIKVAGKQFTIKRLKLLKFDSVVLWRNGNQYMFAGITDKIEHRVLTLTVNRKEVMI